MGDSEAVNRGQVQPRQPPAWLTVASGNGGGGVGGACYGAHGNRKLVTGSGVGGAREGCVCV